MLELAGVGLLKVFIILHFIYYVAFHLLCCINQFRAKITAELRLNINSHHEHCSSITEASGPSRYIILVYRINFYFLLLVAQGFGGETSGKETIGETKT